VSATLGEVCSFLNGGTPSRSVARYFEGSIPWITGADINGPIVNEARSFITEEAIRDSATNRIPRGTVLLVTRTSVGKVAIAGTPLCFSQDITAITPDPNRLDVGYLVHLLRIKQPHFERLSRGATIKGITREAVANIRVSLPPIPEQRRIAEILDKADALRAKRRAALAQLDTLTQSIFLDIFGDAGENPKAWPVRRVSEYVAEFQGGKSLESESGENVVTRNRVLKVSAVTGMTYLAYECKPVPDSYIPPVEHFVRAGDLLFSRANTTDLVGAVAYVERTPQHLLLPDKLWRFVWTQPALVEPLFVWALFQTPALRREIGRRATGTSGSMKNISQEKVFGISTICPPIEIQKEFTKRLTTVEKVRAVCRASAKETDALFTSLQHRAFQGEL
jgi:type I restriction enzyme, S subunit